MRKLLLLCALVAALLQPRASQARHAYRHYLGTIRTTQYLWTGYRTASGAWPFYGEVAADPSIPFGAHVHIPGLGMFVVLDRGGLVFGAHVDIFVWRLNYGIHDYYAGAWWS